jgi:hypothetical protein
MELAMEEKICSMTISERGSDNQPIRYGICLAGRDYKYEERRNKREDFQLQQYDTPDKGFPLQTGRQCRICKNKLYWSSYDKPKLHCLQSSLTNDMVESNICNVEFKRMKQSLQRGDVEKLDEKWSKMFGIRQACWKHPRGSRYAWREGVPKEGHETSGKEEVLKETYVHPRQYGDRIAGTV